jgi:hypothetical protein
VYYGSVVLFLFSQQRIAKAAVCRVGAAAKTKKGTCGCVVSVWLCVSLPSPRLCHCLCEGRTGFVTYVQT